MTGHEPAEQPWARRRSRLGAPQPPTRPPCRREGPTRAPVGPGAGAAGMGQAMSGPRIGELFAGYGGLGMGNVVRLRGTTAWAHRHRQGRQQDPRPPLPRRPEPRGHHDRGLVPGGARGHPHRRLPLSGILPRRSARRHDRRTRSNLWVARRGLSRNPAICGSLGERRVATRTSASTSSQLPGHFRHETDKDDKQGSGRWRSARPARILSRKERTVGAAIDGRVYVGLVDGWRINAGPAQGFNDGNKATAGAEGDARHAYGGNLSRDREVYRRELETQHLAANARQPTSALSPLLDAE